MEINIDFGNKFTLKQNSCNLKHQSFRKTPRRYKKNFNMLFFVQQDPIHGVEFDNNSSIYIKSRRFSRLKKVLKKTHTRALKTKELRKGKKETFKNPPANKAF